MEEKTGKNAITLKLSSKALAIVSNKTPRNKSLKRPKK